MRFTRVAFSVLLIVASATSRANIYGYVDDQGVSHFAAEKLDANYQLWLKGDHSGTAVEAAGQDNTPQFSRLTQHPNLNKYEPLVKLASEEFSVEPELLKAVMAAESGLNPDAISPKGAIGLMQVMPSTAQRYGLAGDKKKSLEQKLRDPATNIRLGARYLADLSKMFPKQQNLVLASYNAGEGAVRQFQNTIPPYRETRNYVQLVTQLYRAYQPKLISRQSAEMELKDVSSAAKRVRVTMGGAAKVVPVRPLPSDR